MKATNTLFNIRTFALVRYDCVQLRNMGESLLHNQDRQLWPGEHFSEHRLQFGYVLTLVGAEAPGYLEMRIGSLQQ